MNELLEKMMAEPSTLYSSICPWCADGDIPEARTTEFHKTQFPGRKWLSHISKSGDLVWCHRIFGQNSVFLIEEMD